MHMSIKSPLVHVKKSPPDCLPSQTCMQEAPGLFSMQGCLLHPHLQRTGGQPEQTRALRGGMPSGAAPEHVQTRACRERAAGMYAVLPYAVAQGAVELPWALGQALVYSCITYFMIYFEIDAAKSAPHPPCTFGNLPCTVLQCGTDTECCSPVLV